MLHSDVSLWKGIHRGFSHTAQQHALFWHVIFHGVYDLRKHDTCCECYGYNGFGMRDETNGYTPYFSLFIVLGRYTVRGMIDDKLSLF